MKIPKQEYTAEFKELVVARVKSGQAISERSLGEAEGVTRVSLHPTQSTKLAADCAEPAGAQLYSHGAQPGVDLRHHLPVDG